MQLRHCTMCNKDKPLDATHFHRDKYGEDGFSRYCKECKTRRKREIYHNGGKVRDLAYAARRRQEHGDLMRQQQRDWYARNIVKARARQKRYRESVKGRAKIRAYRKTPQWKAYYRNWKRKRREARRS